MIKLPHFSILFFLIFSLLACSSEKKKIEVTDFSNYKIVEIPMLAAKMYLPHHYKTNSFSEFKANLLKESSDTMNAYDKKQLKELEKDLDELEKELNISAQLFTDSIEKLNVVLIYKGEYMPFNKTDASHFLYLVVDQLKKETAISGEQFELLQTKYFELTAAKIAKIKFRHYGELGEGFVTKYLITIKGRNTFVLQVLGVVDNDYEHLVKKLMFYK